MVKRLVIGRAPLTQRRLQAAFACESNSLAKRSIVAWIDVPLPVAAGVSVPSVKPQREQRALTDTEIRDLLAASGEERFAVPIRFALASGVRQHEMLSLRWGDVDLTAAAVTVRGTKTARSHRTIELSSTTVEQLRAHLQSQRQRRLFLGPAWQDNGLVFPSTIGTPWIKRTFYRDYKALVRRSEIADPATVTWHALRHSAASQWIKAGVDIDTVSRRLGHSSASFTMDVDAHLLKGQQRQAAEALDYLLA